MKRLTTLTAVALIAGTAAFAQDSAQAELNQNVYAMGMAELTDDGYDVDRVEQDRAGNLTFMAENETTARVMVMDDEGNIMSDVMTDLAANAMIEGESDDEERSGSLSTALGIDSSADVEADEMDDGSSASVGLDTGVDVGISASDSDDSSSASISTGISTGLGISSDS